MNITTAKKKLIELKVRYHALIKIENKLEKEIRKVGSKLDKLDIRISILEDKIYDEESKHKMNPNNFKKAGR